MLESQGKGTFTQDSEAKNSLVYNAADGIAKSVQTAGNVTAKTDPFVDVASFDFHIKAGSSAVGTGVNLGKDFNLDMDGNTRPTEGNWDVGCYQSAPKRSGK
jgi:hypothetical protein